MAGAAWSDEKCLALQCCSPMAHPVLPAPLLLRPPAPPQNFCNTTQKLSPGPGLGEEVGLWLAAESWFLFQFNLQAC